MPETIEKLSMGWLPYEYLLKGLAADWMAILKAEWLDTGEFKT